MATDRQVALEREFQPCIFCSGIAGSEEHVFPEWLQRARNPNGRTLLISVSDPGAKPYSFQSEDLGIKTRVVCHTCNTNWMSKLERQTSPLIKQMLHGETVPLSQRQCTRFARWAVKTATLLRYVVSPPRPTTSARLKHLKGLAEPPARTEVVLARSTDSAFAVTSTCHLVEMKSPIRGEAASLEWLLRAGPFVMRVRDYPSRLRQESPASPDDSRQLLPIWPLDVSAPIVSWPPERTLEREDFDRLVRFDLELFGTPGSLA